MAIFWPLPHFVGRGTHGATLAACGVCTKPNLDFRQNDSVPLLQPLMLSLYRHDREEGKGSLHTANLAQ